MTDLARFEGVTKDYPAGPRRRGPLRALDGVSFRMSAGEVVGLVGPNRAGKTTAAKLLLSLARPTAGRIERLGRPADDRRTLARVGYLPDGPAFPAYHHARGLLALHGILAGLPDPERRGKIPELLARVGLADRDREPIGRYSKGMLQRLGLALALLSEPDLLVLDEPAEGLDLPGRRLLADVVRHRALRGQSTLLIIHATADVGRLCDRVLVLVAGRLVHDGPTAELLDGRRGTLDPALSRLYRKVPT